ncbi:RepB family plasmid replication initiator protein [Paraburkholderia bannensis]|uniref:RepB family plasmid replication initiator protein n=1 Tax=Paraburkholderia bannensis TaxID=765414 RepID=UPI002AB5EA51|nr:RepB family plasmid replication initiator protein [Paraburkholderia bannensis]
MQNKKHILVIVDEIAKKSTGDVLDEATELLVIRNAVVSGKVSLFQINILCAFLQLAKKSENTETPTFEVSIDEFDSVAGFNSINNRKYLHEIADEIMNVHIDIFRCSGQTSPSWLGTARPISEIFIENYERIRYSLSQKTAEMLLDPSTIIQIESLR